MRKVIKVDGGERDTSKINVKGLDRSNWCSYNNAVDERI